MSDFINRRKNLGGTGPKVKPRGGEAKLKESKEAASKFKKLRESLNNMRGVSVAEGVGAAGFRSIANKIGNVIPLVGTLKPKTKKD